LKTDFRPRRLISVIRSALITRAGYRAIFQYLLIHKKSMEADMDNFYGCSPQLIDHVATGDRKGKKQNEKIFFKAILPKEVEQQRSKTQFPALKSHGKPVK
jgi:hypothetical protein